jgi:hypothetical protein
MPETSKSTETIDRLPGMQEEDLRRKIPVDHLSHVNGWGGLFNIHLQMSTTRTHRKEIAALRKEFDAYKQSHHVDRYNNTKGSCWRLSPDLLIRFAGWMEFQEPIDILMERAKQEEKARQEREKKEREEQHRQWHRDRRAYRIPCTNICKVRVLKFECVGGEGPFDKAGEKCRSSCEELDAHRFSLQFEEGATKEEIDAWRYLSKKLEEEQKNRTIVTWRTNSVEGNGSHWTLHEDVLFAYADWLIFDEYIQILMSRAIEKRKQEELRWEEIRDRSWYQRPFLPQRDTSLSKALTLFNLDSSAQLDDVKRRYRVLSKLYHPDTGGNEEEFKRLNQANQVLMQHFA